MVKAENLPLETALRPLTLSPAKSLGLTTSKGSVAIGLDADFLVLKDDFTLNYVMAKGQMMMKEGDVIVKGTFE